MDEKLNDVLLCDIVNTYNVCGKMFGEMGYNVMGDGPSNSLEQGAWNEVLEMIKSPTDCKGDLQIAGSKI